MITLVNVTEQNWLDVISLRVHEKQKRLIGRRGNRGSIMDKSLNKRVKFQRAAVEAGAQKEEG